MPGCSVRDGRGLPPYRDPSSFPEQAPPRGLSVPLGIRRLSPQASGDTLKLRCLNVNSRHMLDLMVLNLPHSGVLSLK